MDNIQTLFSTVHPDDMPSFLASVSESVNNTAPWYYEGRFFHKITGELRWWEGHTIPQHLPNGDVVFNGTLYDVTSYKTVLHELNKSERSYRQIVETTNDGVVQLDQQGLILFTNSQLQELLGYSESELLRLTAFDVVYPDNIETLRTQMANRQDGRNGHYELCLRRKDGSRFWTIVSAVPRITEDGSNGGTIAFLVDISERKQHEHERERLIKDLNEALLFKDQFLATMSHELRTPLNAIIGYAGISQMQEDIPSHVTHMLERITVNSKRLLSLINDILDISRINAKRIEILQRPLNLTKLAQGWNDDFSQQAEKQNLGFAFYLDPELPEMVLGDEERLSQIVANLLQNAIKFTDKGEIKLRLEKQNSNWTVQVSDSGIGIPETWQHLIFEEFRQVDGSSRRKHGGAGLGLSIVQKLCSLMGGSIKVTSKPGEGSTFTVTLPLTVPIHVPQIS